jgi:hypothetical protein
LVHSIGRTTLLEHYITEPERGEIRLVDNSMSRLAFRQLADLKVEMVVVSGDSKVRAHHSPGADVAECPFMTKTDECDLVSRFFCLVQHSTISRKLTVNEQCDWTIEPK